MSPKFSITLLGGFAASRDGSVVELQPACQRVIALVALARRPVARGWVCRRLWPGVPAGSAIRRLNSTSWRLKSHGAEDILEMDRRTIGIATGVYVDWWRAVDLSLRVLAASVPAEPPDPVLLAELMPLLRAGDLLAGWPDEWKVQHCSHYRAMRLQTLGRLSNWLPDAGSQARVGPARHDGAVAVPHRLSVRRPTGD